MSFTISLLCSLIFILSGPTLLWAKKEPPPAPPVKDLEVVINDLQENTQDLRRNITNWRKINWDTHLTPAEKKTWRLKAQAYLQECRDYNAVLEKIDAQKLPKSKASRRFLAERETFQKELQFFEEVLQQP